MKQLTSISFFECVRRIVHKMKPDEKVHSDTSFLSPPFHSVSGPHTCKRNSYWLLVYVFSKSRGRGKSKSLRIHMHVYIFSFLSYYMQCSIGIHSILYLVFLPLTIHPGVTPAQHGEPFFLLSRMHRSPSWQSFNQFSIGWKFRLLLFFYYYRQGHKE